MIIIMKKEYPLNGLEFRCDSYHLSLTACTNPSIDDGTIMNQAHLSHFSDFIVMFSATIIPCEIQVYVVVSQPYNSTMLSLLVM